MTMERDVVFGGESEIEILGSGDVAHAVCLANYKWMSIGGVGSLAWEWRWMCELYYIIPHELYSYYMVFIWHVCGALQ